MANENIFQLNMEERKKTFDVSFFVTTYYFSCKPRFEEQWENYPFSQIFLILDGNGTYTTENGSYPFSAGMMLYRPAGKSSIYHWESKNARLGLISFVCHSEAMATFGEAPIRLCEEEIASLLDLIKTSSRVCCDPLDSKGNFAGMRFREGTPDVVLDFIASSLERFLSMLYCRLRGIKLLLDESQKVNKYIDESRLVEEIKNYLNEHITEQLTISDICAHFGISQTTAMKKFRRESNQGIMEYFTERKILEAKQQIGKTSQSFAEIAEALGFSSANYFSRVFKAKTGMTPTEYSKYASKRNASAGV
ncbi:MAG: helix-turn-helix transcriptional regulator [Clostridia bacterium]|nr:helix-turn-helix transcriptional regulator [Clostridia bacterium]